MVEVDSLCRLVEEKRKMEEKGEFELKGASNEGFYIFCPVTLPVTA